MRSSVIATLFVLIHLQVVSQAHHGPEEVVEDITRQMERDGPSTALLFRRAGELRVLGRHQNAIADLEAALVLQPDHGGSVRLLIRLLQRTGQHTRALALAIRSLETLKAPLDRASVMVAHAESLLATDLPGQAEQYCRRAIGLATKAPVDWYLLHADILRQLERHGDLRRMLKTASENNPSVVLRNAWIDAAIDDGHGESVLDLVEAGLRDSRYQADWLLRCGRIHLQKGQREKAAENFTTALNEIRQRMNRPAHDTLLHLQLARAHACLGNMLEADAALDLARSKGINPYRLRYVERLLRPTAAKKPGVKTKKQ